MNQKKLPPAPVAAAKRQILVLTNNRSFQQNDSQKEQARIAKERLKGKRFETKHKPPRFCKSRKIAFLVYENDRLVKISVSRIGCNSWTCPDCQVAKAIKLKYKLLDIALLNNLGYFLTLTLDPKVIPEKYLGDSTNQTHKYITKIFNHFTTVLRRKKFSYFNERNKRFYTFDLKKQEQKLKYLWVLQFLPQTGIAHLHVLVNQFLPIKIIRKLWQEVGGGVTMDIEKIKNLAATTRYITNYLVDGLKIHESKTPSGFLYFERRYSVSKSCIKPAKNTTRLYPDLTPNQLKAKLEEKKLGSLFADLDNPESDDFEITITPGLPPKIQRLKHDD